MTVLSLPKGPTGDTHKLAIQTQQAADLLRVGSPRLQHTGDHLQYPGADHRVGSFHRLVD
jgi:hypothetical protein